MNCEWGFDYLLVYSAYDDGFGDKLGNSKFTEADQIIIYSDEQKL